MIKCLLQKRGDTAKELTETYGALEAVRKAIDAAEGLPSYNELLKCSSTRVCVYVPGDGKRPYTAAALALSTPASWSIVAIDPLISETFTTRRVTCVMGTAEDYFSSAVTADVDVIIIVAVHAHCDLDACVRHIDPAAHTVVVSLPCCGSCGLVTSRPTLLQWNDVDILSPKRKTSLGTFRLEVMPQARRDPENSARQQGPEGPAQFLERPRHSLC